MTTCSMVLTCSPSKVPCMVTLCCCVPCTLYPVPCTESSEEGSVHAARDTQKAGTFSMNGSILLTFVYTSILLTFVYTTTRTSSSHGGGRHRRAIPADPGRKRSTAAVLMVHYDLSFADLEHTLQASSTSGAEKRKYYK